jgi:hypothetical protein
LHKDIAMPLMIAPPEPPLHVALADDDRKRFWFRQRLMVWTVLTILATGWLCTLGPVPGILGLVVAKHILVALLVMGLGVDQRREVEM